MKPTSKFLLSAGLLALALAAGADDPWQPPPGYHPLPPELQGDLSVGDEPQGADDLERTRNALYGKQLSATQHQEILSWRTHDLDWWMDDSRRAGAKAQLAALDSLFESLVDEEDFADVVDASEDHFGLDVEFHYETAGGGFGGQGAPQTLVQATVTFDARKRPDLFDFYELVSQFAGIAAASPQGEGIFLQVIEPAQETTDGVAAYQGTVAYIESLKVEIGALAKSRLKLALKRYVDWGWTYTVEAADDFQADLRAAIDELTELRTRQYLDALPDDYRKRLSSYVVRQAKAGASQTLGYYSRSLKEAQAADFEALLADWRGGEG